MDLAALAAELAVGHPETGSYDGDDAAAADQINAVNRTQLRSLTMADLREWAAQNARGLKVFRGITGGVNDDVKNLCYVADRMLGSDTTTLNPGDPLHASLIQGLVAGGVIDSDDAMALAAQATDTVSRADELGLGRVRVGHVSEARG